MPSDWLFIFALVFAYRKWISVPNGIGDWIAAVMGTLLLFAICKLPGIVLMQGWRNFMVEPADPVVLDHFIAGVISLAIVGGFYYWLSARIAKRRTS